MRHSLLATALLLCTLPLHGSTCNLPGPSGDYTDYVESELVDRLDAQRQVMIELGEVAHEELADNQNALAEASEYYAEAREEFAHAVQEVARDITASSETVSLASHSARLDNSVDPLIDLYELIEFYYGTSHAAAGTLSWGSVISTVAPLASDVYRHLANARGRRAAASALVADMQVPSFSELPMD